MSELKQDIISLVENQLSDGLHYLVEVKIEEKSGKKKLQILIDSDQGVSIDYCASLSRALSEVLEAKEYFGDAYLLEVSSPGIDYPLTEKRQYLKNQGRMLKVHLSSGQEILGKLKAVEELGIKLGYTQKIKGKKSQEEERIFSFEEIKKSYVQVSFN